MRVTDPETGEVTYEWPVTFYNQDGNDYNVNSQEELDFHLTNGWDFVKPDPIEPPPPPVNDIDFRTLASEFKSFRTIQKKEITKLQERLTEEAAAHNALMDRVAVLEALLVEAPK